MKASELIDIYKTIIYQLKKEELVYVLRRKNLIKDKDELDSQAIFCDFLDRLTVENAHEELRFIKNKLIKLYNEYFAKNETENYKRISVLLGKIAGGNPELNYNAGRNEMEKEDYRAAVVHFNKTFDVLMSSEKLDETLCLNLLDNFCCCLNMLSEDQRVVDICTAILNRSCTKKVEHCARANLGLALLKGMRREEALGQFMKVLTDDPSNIDAKVGLVHYYDAIGDYDSMKKYCRQILEVNSKDDFVLFQLGMAHIFSGDREEGRKCLIEAYKLDPSNPCVKRNLLQCLYELGKVKMLTSCDEIDFIDKLADSGEGDKIIKKELEGSDVQAMKDKLEKLFNI